MRVRLYVISAWSIIDPLYFFFTRLHYLEQTKKNDTIFRVRLTRYKGRLVVLSDGTMIKKNDVLVKIHLHNARLLKELQSIDTDFKKAMLLYKKVKESLPHLALYIQRHKNKGEIKGIIGITMLTKGCERLGFESYTISSPTYKWFKKLALYPIYLLSMSKLPPKGKKRPSPKYVFMSKESLYEKSELNKSG
ncbi:MULTISPECIES: YkoP family protein [Metabacillus]|uniref:Uncharacterized protein n=1 Tax=Metabacillus hrfriensis TaxID=3048891 RepID=A0ACD4RE65_9BACI|nr:MULTISPECIES: hypothetical protein [Metabacillus]UAL53095.1 hypothetical protein K8L98_04635 [Metabacillus dongyingensis]USK29419.1 hypothetical protein LIT32_04660 [Bacillus sp. CMF21]WHZ58643.1 hypothetical protein QLQ22_04660 [Metabacillus sp. CT-WN-B3]